MLKFNDCIFSAAGASVKDSVYGISISGAEDVQIKDCEFNGKGYSAIMNHGSGELFVSGCKFECGNFYNPIEGSQVVENGNVTVENCEFVGVPGNNFINFYKVADGSKHAVSGCTFAGGTANNIIRFSNRNNASATFDVENCAYEYTTGEADEYSNFMLFQDYTNKSGVKQDFTKYTVNIKGLQKPEIGELFYVYEDGAGIITGNGNDPVINEL